MKLPEEVFPGICLLALGPVPLEIEAHTELAGLPVSSFQIDNKEDVVWLANGVVTLGNPTDPNSSRKKSIYRRRFQRPDHEITYRGNYSNRSTHAY